MGRLGAPENRATEGDEMYKHLLITTDGSEVAQRGVDQGLALAKALGAEATIVTITEPFPIYAVGSGYVPPELADYDNIQKEFAQKVLEAAKAQADAAGVKVTTLHVPNRQPAETIIETAQSRGCDAIVMASHGRRGLGRLVLGSQTSEVLAHSKLPVLVVR